MNLQWYPGHMTKAKRQMQEDLKLIDLIIELVDALRPADSDDTAAATQSLHALCYLLQTRPELRDGLRLALLRLPELYGGAEALDAAARELPALPEITAALDALRQLQAHQASGFAEKDLATVIQHVEAQ